MNERIVVNPTVVMVGSTQFNAKGLEQFVEAEGLSDVAQNDSPIRRILNTAWGAETDYTDEESMPEFGGRFCYRSWEKGRTTHEYNENILAERHGSVLEHTTLNLVITGVSRSLSLELARHRAGVAISQESQRYVDARTARAVMPPLMVHYLQGDTSCGEAQDWFADFQQSVEAYERWQEWYRLTIMGDDKLSDVKARTAVKKRVNEAARAQLPNDTETKLLWTANLRTLRHFIMTRGSEHADLEICRLAAEVAKVCKNTAPTVFDDIKITPGAFGVSNVTGQHWKV